MAAAIFWNKSRPEGAPDPHEKAQRPRQKACALIRCRGLYPLPAIVGPDTLPDHYLNRYHVMHLKTFITLSILVFLGIMNLSNTSTGAAPGPKRGNLVHMVSFKFKDSSTKQDRTQVEKAFAALNKKIPQIISYEWGTNNSPEGLNKGFTHGFVLTFHSNQDRDDYLIHPHHKAFGALVGPLLEDVFVVDFWNKTE